MSMISHTQGWLHCDIPGTDASGVVKSLMDELHARIHVNEEMPNRVRMTTSCCQINCGGQGDIAINVQYVKPPKINHDLVANVCERPAVVARCPVAAIRPAMVNGKPSLESMRKNAFVAAPVIHLVRQCRSTARTRPSWRSGLVANTPTRARSRPSTSWSPQTCRTIRRAGLKVTEIVKTILYAYKDDARAWERMGEWIERIGWPRFLRDDRAGLYQAPD